MEIFFKVGGKGMIEEDIFNGYQIYCATKEYQVRKHKKKRINKKWRKRYGFYEFNMMPHNEIAIMDNKVIWMTKKTFEELKKSIKKQETRFDQKNNRFKQQNAEGKKSNVILK